MNEIIGYFVGCFIGMWIGNNVRSYLNVSKRNAIFLKIENLKAKYDSPEFSKELDIVVDLLKKVGGP